MLPLRWFKVLRALGLEFWLPLPLLALGFWAGSGFLLDWILSRSYQTGQYLQPNTQPTRQSPRTVVAIKAKIDKVDRVSLVTVKTDNSPLKELKFQFPLTEFSDIEAAISKELGLSSEEVRKLIVYQVVRNS